MKESPGRGHDLVKPLAGRPAFIDPLCGSGTIPIEAGLIGRNIALDSTASSMPKNGPAAQPGMAASPRGARDSILTDQPLGIMGFDLDGQVLELARYHARQAGLGIHYPSNGSRLATCAPIITMVSLSPIPLRGASLEKAEVESLYQQMGTVFNNLDTWSF